MEGKSKSLKKRVTVVLDENVEKHVDLFCAVMSVTKQSVVRDAIISYLKAKNNEFQEAVKAITEASE